MQESVRHIVLYGSLRAGQPQFVAHGLDSAFKALGPVTLKGRMLDLGDFPGVVLDGGDEIIAELFEILDRSVLAPLDAYEEYDPQDKRRRSAGSKEGSLYLREVVDTLAGPAFIYVYNGLGEARDMPHGDWLRWMREREA